MKVMSRKTNQTVWMEGGGKKKSTSQKSKRLLFFPLIMIFLMGGSLFYVWSRIQVIQLGYEISNALKEGSTLAEANNKLRVEIATLKSYARIEKVAVEELKMSKPTTDQVVVIR